MIISTGEVRCVLAAVGELRRLPPGETTVADPGEDEVRWCKAAVKLAPVVRQERVQVIRAALTMAGYRENAEEVAAKMIERSLVDTAFDRGSIRKTLTART